MNASIEELDPRTCNYDLFVTRLMKRMPGGIVEDLLHAAIGIGGEATETLSAGMRDDTDNRLEELGDLGFYATAMANYLETTLQREIAFSHSLVSDDAASFPGLGNKHRILAVAAGDLLDQVKKLWVYKREPTTSALDDLRAQLGRVAYYHHTMCVKYGGSVERVQEMNRSKLLRRYEGGKYSDASALARADKA